MSIFGLTSRGGQRDSDPPSAQGGGFQCIRQTCVEAMASIIGNRPSVEADRQWHRDNQYSPMTAPPPFVQTVRPEPYDTTTDRLGAMGSGHEGNARIPTYRAATKGFVGGAATRNTHANPVPPTSFPKTLS